MLGFLWFLPFVYILAGCTYGVAAVARRIYLSSQFSQLTGDEQNTWRDSAAKRPLGGLQVTSAIFSVLLLLSALFAVLGLTSTANVGDLAGYSLLGLVLLPPFVVVFQAAGVWRRKSAFLEEAGLRGGNGAMRFYYTVLIATWVVGIVGSYILGFFSLSTFF